MGNEQIKLRLKDLNCANCAAKIEKEVNEFKEVKNASLNFSLGFITVTINEGFEYSRVRKKIESLVKKIEPSVIVSDYNSCSIEGRNKFKENISLFVGIMIYLVSVLFLRNTSYELVGFLISFIIIGSKVLLRALKNILKGEIFDENFLMSVATVGAFVIKQYPEAVAVMMFYEIGEIFQDYAVKRSRKSISSLMDIRSDFANKLVDNEEVKVSPDEVKVNDIIVVKPGERVPLDGIVLEGKSSLDTSALTGESVFRTINANETILSGTINISGVLKVRVTKLLKESTVSRMLELVENAASKKAKTEKFITKFARVYTPIVVLLAVIVAFIPPILGLGDFSEWIYRSLIFLVVSCPCALVISVPLALFAGIGGASKEGVLIKGGNYIELLSNVSTVVFDKTGTLTKGTFNVVEVRSLSIFKKQDIIKVAAYAESFSSHPIAQSIMNYYKSNLDNSKMDHSLIKGYEEIPGQGVRAIIDGKEVLVGNSKLMSIKGIDFEVEDSPGTIVYVAIDGIFGGYIVISDEIKETSKKAIKQLKNMGIKKTVMLTGDSKKIAKSVAENIGIDEVYYELLPQNKVQKLEAILSLSKGGSVVFVGDGINDAPVLARADIGVAMGDIGSDAAIEAADIVLMRDDPLALSIAIKIGRKTTLILWENIIFALFIKMLVLILSTIGIANMWYGVFADVGVTLIAVLNSMRALKIKK